MNRLLQRSGGDRAVLTLGPLRVDLKQRVAWAKEVGLSLGKKEFDILVVLLKRVGEVVTRNDLLDAFGEGGEIYDRTIDSHLSHLRKKMRTAGLAEILISPVYGVGYRLEYRPLQSK